MKERKNGLYRADPLWAVIMAQLKTSALELSWSLNGSSRDHSPSPTQQEKVEEFLGKIEDCLELTSSDPDTSSPLSAVSIAQLFEDLAENVGRRLGQKAGGISFAIDSNLPKVRARPLQLMRIIDCFTRAVYRLSARPPARIVVERKRPRIRFFEGSTIRLAFRSSELISHVGSEKLHTSLQRFRVGDYTLAVFNLGIELCSILHMIRQMGGIIRCEAVDDHRFLLEVELKLERTDEEVAAVPVPSIFFLASNSSLSRRTIQRMADFHAASLELVEDSSAIPEGEVLLHDVSEEPEVNMSALTLLASPERTVLLLPAGSEKKFSDLAALGFRALVTLPLVSTRLIRSIAGQLPYAPLASTPKSTAHRKLRVLVVDDSETARIIIADYLEAEGHTVVQASDGAEFTDLVKQGDGFDVVFCDINMCHIDGHTAVKFLREHESNSGRHTPVVGMTAYAALETDIIPAAKTFDLTFNKPVDGAMIDKALQELIPGAAEDLSPTTEIILLEDLRRRCAGRTKTMVRVLDSFVSSSREHLPKLRTAAEETTLAKTLHALKGLLRDVGAVDAGQALERLEEKLRADSALTPEDYAHIEEWVQLTCESAEKAKQELLSVGE